MKIGKFDLSAAGATLVATIASGTTFIIASLFVFNGVPAANLTAYIPRGALNRADQRRDRADPLSCR